MRLYFWHQFEHASLTLDPGRPGGIDHFDIILPDWWWLGREHHFGRNGHGASCPFTMTLLMHWHRLRGKKAFWYCWLPQWLQEDGYESANPVMLLDDNLHAIAPPSWVPFWWYRQFEPWLLGGLQKWLKRPAMGQAIANSTYLDRLDRHTTSDRGDWMQLISGKP